MIKRFHIRLNEEENEILTIRSRQTDRTRSDLIREAIRAMDKKNKIHEAKVDG